MHRLIRSVSLITVILAISAGSAIATTTLLDADFQAHTVDDPIGTGGPTVGEPIAITNMDAIIKNGVPFGSKYLQLRDRSTLNETIRFGFLNEAKVDTGTLSISFDLAVGNQDLFMTFSNQIPGQGGSPILLRFDADSDSMEITGNGGPVHYAAPYVEQQVYSFRFDFFHDFDFCDVYIDAVPWVTGAPFNDTTPMTAEVAITLLNDPDSTGVVGIDNILATIAEDEYVGVAGGADDAGGADARSGSSGLHLAVGPNPTRGATGIAWALGTGSAGSAGGVASIAVYDMSGRLVRELASGSPLAAGGTAHGTAHWDGRDAGGRRVPSGVYFVRLDSGDRTETRRLSLVR